MLWIVSLIFGVLAAACAAIYSTAGNATFFSAVGLFFALLGALADSLSVIVLRGLDDFFKETSGSSASVDELAHKIRRIRVQSVRLLFGGGGAKTVAVSVLVAQLSGKIPDSTLPTILAVGLGMAAFAVPLALQQIVNYFTITDAIAKRKVAIQRATERAEYLDRLSKASSPADLDSDPHLKGYSAILKPKS